MFKEKEIKRWFLQAVDNNKTASIELKRSLKKRTQMIDTYIKTLHREFIKSHASAKAQKKPFKLETYKWFVGEMANSFVESIEKVATQRMASDLERLRIKKENDDKKDMEETFKGNTSGDLKGYVDEGSLILDENQLQR